MRKTPGFARSATGTVTNIALLLTCVAASGPVRPTDVGVPLKTPAELNPIPGGRPIALQV